MDGSRGYVPVATQQGNTGLLRHAKVHHVQQVRRRCGATAPALATRLGTRLGSRLAGPALAGPTPTSATTRRLVATSWRRTGAGPIVVAGSGGCSGGILGARAVVGSLVPLLRVREVDIAKRQQLGGSHKVSRVRELQDHLSLVLDGLYLLCLRPVAGTVPLARPRRLHAQPLHLLHAALALCRRLGPVAARLSMLGDVRLRGAAANEWRCRGG